MLDKKKNRTGNDKQSNNSILEPKDAADALANLTAGMDIFSLDIYSLDNAPEDWNFYKPLSVNKMEELINSIKENGLLNPIIVWEKGNGRYMILSGHNRKEVFRMLYEDEKNPERDKYKKIHCYVKKRDEITENAAKTIIIDTNWVQRTLSIEEKAKSILVKYTELGRKEYASSSDGTRTRDIVSEDYSISGRQVSNYLRLNYLIPEIKELAFNNNISIKSGVKLSYFSEPTQKWIYDNYKDIFNNRNILKLNKDMSRDEITNIFFKENVETIKNEELNNEVVNKYMTTNINGAVAENKVFIPLEHQEEFKVLVANFLDKHEIS